MLPSYCHLEHLSISFSNQVASTMATGTGTPQCLSGTHILWSSGDNQIDEGRDHETMHKVLLEEQRKLAARSQGTISVTVLPQSPTPEAVALS